MPLGFTLGCVPSALQADQSEPQTRHRAQGYNRFGVETMTASDQAMYTKLTATVKKPEC